MKWKEVHNQDGSEALFGAFRVANIGEASRKADEAIKIIKSHRDDNHSHMSLSHEGLIIMLHGISKEEFTDKDWAIAEEIQKALSD